MFSPRRFLKTPSTLQWLLHSTRLVLILAAFSSAAFSLGWAASGTWIEPNACGILGIAHLFGGLLLLSGCTWRTGALWASGTFAATALLALFQGAWLVALVAPIMVGIAAFAFGSSAEPCSRGRVAGPRICGAD